MVVVADDVLVRVGWGINDDSFVSIDSLGNRVSISDIAADENGTNTGLIRTFDWNGSNWIQIGSTIQGSQNDESFGYSHNLSSDGNRLIIGQRSNATNIKIYEFNGTNWNILGSPISLATNGGSVAANNMLDKVFISIGNDGVYAYQEINGNWIQQGNKINFCWNSSD